MNETETRAELVDPLLKKAGWETGGDVRVRREFAINDGQINADGARGKRLVADYVLCYKNVNLAVVEAKRRDFPVNEGVGQAKLYAEKLQLKTCFATNGKDIYQACQKTGEEGPVDKFPSPQELWQRLYGGGSEWREKFNNVPFEPVNGKTARYYQEIAVNRATDAIAAGRPRVLLTLATGTGKTFVAFQIAWKLFQSRWTLQKDGGRRPRILFLVDRNFLADQAYLGFGAFADDALARINPQEIRRRGDAPKNANVFFTLFQTFMSGEEGKRCYEQYEPDFFDLVIVDECHRGGADEQSHWRAILDHFGAAVHLGMTATPKRDDNIDTYDYFGQPVFTYKLKDGIGDGFLTPFKVKAIRSTIDEYVYDDDDEVQKGEPEEGRVYKEKDFNRLIEIEARERERVRQILSHIGENEKTIVFCANQAHAAKVRDLISQEAAGRPLNYCVRVTAADGEQGENYLREFTDDEKIIPAVLTTSRKLSTGLDAPNVRHIALMRPVKSMIEFKQIIGRGTRVYEGKNYFTIIDFVQAYRKFQDPEWDGQPVDIDKPDKPIRGRGGKKPPPPPPPPDSPPKMIVIELSDGSRRSIKSVVSTQLFIDGRVVDAKEFVERLFNALVPKPLDSEETLRKIWGSPRARRELLSRIEEAGCTKEGLESLQELIDAKDGDLFDVLAYIAHNLPPLTRAARVQANGGKVYEMLSPEERDFVRYVLENYVRNGVDELDEDNIGSILQGKYRTIADAKETLGKNVEEIKKIFTDFQKHLYQKAG